MNIKVILEKEKGRGMKASVPSLPGCVGYGTTESDALENVRSAVLCHFGIEEVLQAHNSVSERPDSRVRRQRIGSKMSTEKKFATVVTLTGLFFMAVVVWTAKLFASLSH